MKRYGARPAIVQWQQRQVGLEFKANVICRVSGQLGQSSEKALEEGGSRGEEQGGERISPADPWTKLLSRLGNAGAHRFCLP